MTNQRIDHRTPVDLACSTGRRLYVRVSARRIGREFLHALVGLPLGAAAFSWEVSEIAVGASLIATVIGLPLLVLGGLSARWLGSRLRTFSNAMAGVDVPAPAPFHPRGGVLGWLRSGITDGVAWRARLYLLLKLPLGLLSSVTAVVLYSSGLTAMTYLMWRPFTAYDASTGSYIARHHLDSTVNLSVLAFAGAVVLILTPGAVRGVLALDRMLVRRLLGPRFRADAEYDVTRSGY